MSPFELGILVGAGTSGLVVMIIGGLLTLMSEDKKCCICGSVTEVEETVLSDAQNAQRTVLCCERCFMTGRIFDVGDLSTNGSYRPTARKMADMQEVVSE